MSSLRDLIAHFPLPRVPTRDAFLAIKDEYLERLYPISLARSQSMFNYGKLRTTNIDFCDVAQESMIKVYLCYGLNGRRIAPIISYTIMITDYAGLMALRKARSKKGALGQGWKLQSKEAHRNFNDMEIEQQSIDPLGLDALIKIENEFRLVAAIRQLTDIEQKIISLRYDHDFTFEECAAILGIPVGTLKTKVMNIKLRIQDLLKPFFPEYDDDS